MQLLNRRVWSQLVCRGTRLARGIAAGTVAQRNAVQVTGRRVPRPLAGARPGPLAASRRRARHGGARGAGDASGAVGAAAAILIASTIFDSHSEPSVLVRLASGALERGEYDEAHRLLQQAIAKGSADAHYLLGTLYFTGTGVPESAEKAIYHLEKAVAAGLPAHAILAPMLIQSGSYRGVTRGLAMLEEGAEKGSARCLQTLGEIHFSGLHAAGLLWNVTIPPDMERSWEYFVRSAALDNPEALLMMSIVRFTEYRQQLREQNDADAKAEEGGGQNQGKLEEAVQLVRQAVEQGSSKAMVAMATLYTTGEFFPVDVPRAVLMLEGAVAENEPDALAMLGNLYYFGAPGVPPNSERAYELLSRAHEMGALADNPDARLAYAQLLRLGFGPSEERSAEEDHRRSLSVLKAMVEEGVWLARPFFAQAVMEGPRGGEGGDIALGVALLKQFASKDCAPSAALLASLSRSVGDMEEHARWQARAVEMGCSDTIVSLLCERAATATDVSTLREIQETLYERGRRGCTVATLQLAVSLLEGIPGVQEANPTLGKRVLEEVIFSTTANGSMRAGQIYEHGYHGVHVDVRRAVQVYTRAAHLGNRNAMYSIGRLYHAGLVDSSKEGRGGSGGDGAGATEPDNDAIAARWYRRAADGHFPPAMAALGVFYVQGLGGLPKDETLGRLYLVRAAKGGVGKAAHNLALMDEAAGEYESAFGWHSLAAELGVPEAHVSLGLMHENGVGTAKNVRLAYEAYLKAIGSGAREGRDCFTRLLRAHPEMMEESKRAT